MHRHLSMLTLTLLIVYTDLKRWGRNWYDLGLRQMLSIYVLIEKPWSV